MMMEPRSLFALFVIFRCYFSCTASSEVLVACEPVSLIPGASCGPVKRLEKSCNGLTPYDYNGELLRCLGEEVNEAIDGGDNCEPCSNQPTSNIPCDNSDELNVTFSLTPFNYRGYSLTVRLNFTSSSVIVKYGLKLFLPGLTVTEYLCACISGTEPTYTFTKIGYGSKEYNNCLQVKTFPCRLHPPKTIELPSPTFCADTKRKIPYDPETCGFPKLEKLPNITLECNSSHTNISWGTPYYIEPGTMKPIEVKLDTYYISVLTCDGKKTNFTVRNSTKITLNIPGYFNFFLYAHYPCSALYDYQLNNAAVVTCSDFATCADSSEDSKACCTTTSVVCPVVPSPSPSPSVNSTENGYDYSSLTYIMAGIGVPILIVTVVLVVLIFAVHKCKSSVYWPLPNVNKSTKSFAHSALVIYSPSTPDLEKRAIMQSFVEIQNFKTGVDLQDTRKPKQSMTNWILEHYEEASAVFCVCNEEFYHDWENCENTNSALVVQTLRLLFEGDLTSLTLKKYAVVLSKPADDVYIPSILKTLPRINMEDTPALAKFAGRESSPF